MCAPGRCAPLSRRRGCGSALGLSNLVLPQSTAAVPGRVRLWPYQKQIADAIGDPTIERVTLVKPVRVGFTTLLTGAVGAFVANDPAPILALLPTESDCRDYVVSEIEPIFAATPILTGLLTAGETDDIDRNTLLHRRFPGGSLKVVASRAPRNLRRHTARILLVDEADGMELTAEGNPVLLAERRTLSFPNRKIVLGSTPKFQDTSIVLRSYAESDQRIFECPCPECGAFHELSWADIEWEPDRPETAAYCCSSCKALIPESCKPAMIAAGQWRITAPSVRNHAGFRLNALVSLLANASWARLAAEFLAAKSDPAELQVFTNTILAQGWRAPGAEIDEASLAARAEPFDLDRIPEAVLLLVAGVDVSDDKLDLVVTGWSKANECFVLERGQIWGNPETDRGVWAELDALLTARFAHPFGGQLGISVTVIDSGFCTDRVYEYCGSRLRRRVFAGKGIPGARPPFSLAKARASVADRKLRLALIGVDACKEQIFQRLEHGRSIRFSDTLTPDFYEELGAERRVVHFSRGQPTRRFEKKTRHLRAEALDCICYCFAGRAALRGVSMEQIEYMLRNPAAPPPVPGEPREPWMKPREGGWLDRREG
jgi:phage terminase large subunit GpA-like protein